GRRSRIKRPGSAHELRKRPLCLDSCTATGTAIQVSAKLIQFLALKAVMQIAQDLAAVLVTCTHFIQHLSVSTPDLSRPLHNTPGTKIFPSRGLSFARRFPCAGWVNNSCSSPREARRHQKQIAKLSARSCQARHDCP